jgi:hypothetical protein
MVVAVAAQAVDEFVVLDQALDGHPCRDGDAGSFRRVVHAGLYAVEPVQPLLDLGRARSAGHATDGEGYLGSLGGASPDELDTGHVR